MRLMMFIALGFLFLSASDSVHALDLGQAKCGPEYAAIHIEFARGLKNRSMLEGLIKNLSIAETNFNNIFAGKESKTNLHKELIFAFKHRNDEADGRDISVPLGSEKSVATQLIDAKIASSVTHAVGICGGAEVGYALVKKTIAPDLTQPSNFEHYAESATKSYLNLAGGSSSFEPGPLQIAPFPPGYATKRMSVTLPSEFSRGKQFAGTWDKFDILLGLLSTYNDNYVLVIHVENLKVANKVTQHPNPPANEFFHSLSPENYQAEYVAAASVAQFIGGGKERCLLEAEDFDARNEGAFRCTLKFEYR